MQAHRMRVVVPEDHRVEIQLPDSIRSGPVELIVLVPADRAEDESRKPEGQGRMTALAADLAREAAAVP